MRKYRRTGERAAEYYHMVNMANMLAVHTLWDIIQNSKPGVWLGSDVMETTRALWDIGAQHSIA